MPLYTLVDTTDSLHPKLTTIPYPKAGQTNSAVKVGLIAATGGAPTWIELPGDPRQNYVPRLEWIPGGLGLVLQQLDRRQQHLTVWHVDAATGVAHAWFSEAEPAAWLDVVDDWRWLPDGALLWLSERDGWRHAWAVTGQDWRCLTPGDYDLTEVYAVDAARKLLYFQASPGCHAALPVPRAAHERAARARDAAGPAGHARYDLAEALRAAHARR